VVAFYSRSKTSGILRYDPNNGALLELIGSFVDLKTFGKSVEYNIIQGICTETKIITLLNCFQTGF